MRAKRRFNIGLWVLLCVPCLLASCDHDVHDGEGDGGLSVSLAWADEADEGTEVKDVKTWIVNATDGTQVAQSQYGSAQEMAKERYDLPEGNYRILTTTNLVDPFTISEQTRAVGNINSLAIGLLLLQKNEDGTFGTASYTKEECDIPLKIAVPGETLKTETLRLMPTANGFHTTKLLIQLTSPEGVVSNYDIEAPVMKSGGKYQINLEYEEMKPYMYLTSTKIDDWTEGWVYRGEILNPED